MPFMAQFTDAEQSSFAKIGSGQTEGKLRSYHATGRDDISAGKLPVTIYSLNYTRGGGGLPPQPMNNYDMVKSPGEKTAFLSI